MTRKPRKNSHRVIPSKNKLQEPMLKIKESQSGINIFSIFMGIDGIFGINIYFTDIYELILY